MPHKFNAARRNKFDKAQYRVINWAEYNDSLRQRGDLTIWVSDEAHSVWSAPHVAGWPAEILGSRYRDMPAAAHGVSGWVATNAGTDGLHRHAHGVGYTGAGLLHTVTSRKRLEHRSGDEASRICAKGRLVAPCPRAPGCGYTVAKERSDPTAIGAGSNRSGYNDRTRTACVRTHRLTLPLGKGRIPSPPRSMQQRSFLPTREARRTWDTYAIR